MVVACPHCRGRYLPAKEAIANGAAFLASRHPLRCANCKGLSFVGLRGRNAIGGIIVLAIGVVLSYPSPISDKIVSGFPDYMLGAIRADIWSVAIMLALMIHVFGSPLQKVEGNIASSPRNIPAFLGTMAFLASLFLYGVYIFLV